MKRLSTFLIAMALLIVAPVVLIVPPVSATIQWANNATSIIADSGGISAGATSMTVYAGHGDRFPAVASPHYFMATLVDSSGNREIVKVTARTTSSNTMTIERAQEGTSARAFAAGSLVELRVTKNALDYLSKAADINEGWYVADASAADQGATTNSRSLASLVAAIGSKQATIVVPNTGTGTTTTYTLGTDLTIPVTISLYIPKGALISASAGKTLTINGIVQAGAYQAFTGAGTVTVNTYPKDQAWWGSAQRLDAKLNPVLGSDADGDIYYRSSSVLARLAKGTAGQILTMNGTATAPEWGTSDREQVYNLKPAVNVAVNKLDIFSKTGGAAPDASNPIKVMVPDGNGYTQRTRAAAYLSGTLQFVLADAAAYWGAVDGQTIKVHIYAIWDGTGVVMAASRFSGFRNVPASTTATDPEYFLLEAGSTYTRNAAHRCVSVGHFWATYSTAGAPDWTILASAGLEPEVAWNTKSDYGYKVNKATSTTGSATIAEAQMATVTVKQSGIYDIDVKEYFNSVGGSMTARAYLKTGNTTYGSATLISTGEGYEAGAGQSMNIAFSVKGVYLSSGEAIHLGGYISAAAGGVKIVGDGDVTGATVLSFRRAD